MNTTRSSLVVCALVTALVVCAASARVGAQTVTVDPATAPHVEAAVACPAGEVAVGGHCCGPTQTWDAARGGCASETRLPDPLVGDLRMAAPLKNPFALPSSVSLVAANPYDVYRVSLQSAGGARASCTTPCIVTTLPPGYAMMDVTGAGRIRSGISIGYGAATYRIDHRMGGRIGGYVGGGLTAAVGTALTIGGLVAVLGMPDCETTTTPGSLAFERCTSANGTATALGIIALTAGLIAVPIGGVLLASAGSVRPVTLMPAYRTFARAPGGPRLAGVGAAPIAGGGVGTVRFVF